MGQQVGGLALPQFALAEQPGLEFRAIVDIQPSQEFAPVERERGVERGEIWASMPTSGIARQRLEAGDIDLPVDRAASKSLKAPLPLPPFPRAEEQGRR